VLDVQVNLALSDILYRDILEVGPQMTSPVAGNGDITLFPALIVVSAYRHALDLEDVNLAILQIGYKRNKNGYKFTLIEDKFDLFLAARQIWNNEVKDKQPHAKDFPISIKLTGVEPPQQ
jgi:hypothetical protein